MSVHLVYLHYSDFQWPLNLLSFKRKKEEELVHIIALGKKNNRAPGNLGVIIQTGIRSRVNLYVSKFVFIHENNKGASSKP